MGLLCDIAVKELHKMFKSVSYSCLILLTCMNHRSFGMFENITFLEAVLTPLVFFLNFFIFHRTSPFVHIKEEPPSPTYSPEVEEVCPVEVEVEALSGVPVTHPFPLQPSSTPSSRRASPSPPQARLPVTRSVWVWPAWTSEFYQHMHIQLGQTKLLPSLLILSSVFPYWVTLFPIVPF